MIFAFWLPRPGVPKERRLSDGEISIEGRWNFYETPIDILLQTPYFPSCLLDFKHFKATIFPHGSIFEMPVAPLPQVLYLATDEVQTAEAFRKARTVKDWRLVKIALASHNNWWSE